ncbi:hypothetical protein [Salmonirosea aquatica]|uniref:TIGR02588 family protein n=1 Tax=Salmonirosea aquatica TaxID=2654236 RepID=A0A7C9BLV8_9BACT|nr:hypothetical protein [Cytophagaceae bacterium SJW1-29]
MARKKESGYQNKKNWFEWTVFGVGLGLVMSILGYLVFKTATYTAGPPALFVEYFPEPGKYEPNRYHVILHNKGNETAESVTVELSLQKYGQEPETAELAFDYCPKESTREGWISFSTRPTPTDTVRTRVVSYDRP